MQPEVSICVPNYNYGEYIGECIRSLLAQTFVDFELIIVDDASTDNSMEIIESFDDNRIQIYENSENLGMAANWNRCWQLAHGKYVAIYHSDDVYHSRIVAEEHSLLSQFPFVGLVSTKATNDEIHLGIDPSGLKFIVYSPYEFMHRLFCGNTLVCSSVMVKRECYETLGGYKPDFVYALDQEFYLRLCHSYGYVMIDYPMVFYRQSNIKSFSSATGDEKARHEKRIAEMKYLKSVAKDIRDAYVADINDHLLHYQIIQNINLSRRYELAGNKLAADMCFARAQRQNQRTKRKFPAIERGVI